jgi:predicted nucleic acid-binding Zn ribbon protein
MAQIVEHKHCEVCGAVVDPSERTCSLKCSEALQDVQRQKKRTAILFVIMIVGAVILTKIPSPF